VAPRPTPVYALVAVFSWPLLRFAFRYRARGLENVPREGGFVLAANHVSNFDPWALGMGLFPRRFLRFMAKSELFWFPLGPVIAAAGAFKVRRGQRDEEAMRTAEELARRGHVIAMFPEGTRRKKGLRKKFQPRAHSGAARIAIGADVPLVPAAIKGTDRLARLAALKVVYGPPIPLEGLDPEEATDRLMEEIRRLEATL
jgi:1-acyl-sn-glycerol-3-phosphate acyltransferase